MSLARKHFCDASPRGGYGGSACPRKYGMNWSMPASGEQQAGLRGGDQRRRADACVPALLEERQEGLTDPAHRPSGESTGGVRRGRSPCGLRHRVAREAALAAQLASRSSIARLPSSIDSGDELREVQQAALRLAGDASAGATRCGLLAGPARGDDRAGRRRRRARARPRSRASLLDSPRAFANALRKPGAHADDLHQRARGGLLDQAGELLDAADDVARRSRASCRPGRARGSPARPSP